MQVTDIFQAYGDADQAVTNTGRFTLLRCQATMGSGRRMSNRGFAVTQVGSDRDQTCRVDKAPRAFFAALDLKTDHGTKAVIVRGIQDVILVLEDGSQMPLGLGGYLDLGIADTMEDLLVNFIGAVVFSAIGFIYVKTRGRSRIAPQFIPQVLDVPEEAEEDSAAKAGGGAAQEGGVEKLEE